MNNIISINNMSKLYGSFKALNAISTAFREGETTCIIGSSGSGKSTLLRTINGLESIEEGSIVVNGISLPNNNKNLRKIRTEVGMVFQSFNLFPHMTVRKNLLLPMMRVRKLSTADANCRAEQLLDRVGVVDQIDKYPQQLSGGQQQRVAIARALGIQPKVMLFDEPTSALDPEMVNEVLLTIKQLAETGMTMLIVTHEISFAREVADRMIFMASGEIVCDEPTEDFFTTQRDNSLSKFLATIL